MCCAHYHRQTHSILCVCVSVCIYIYSLGCLPDFHVHGVHPPNVRVKDEIICIFPMDSMSLDGFRLYDPSRYAVYFWII